MDQNAQKEQFSFAHICAMVAVAGFNIGLWRIDQDSVDLTISGGDTPELPSQPKLDVQLKCTGTDDRDGPVIHFRLRRKNYDDLRLRRRSTPIILVVVEVPPDVEDWLLHSEQEVAIRHCGYWLSLQGSPETTNTSTVTVEIPRTQAFTVEALKEIMARIEDESFP